MGILTTALGFGAGYVLGARKGTDPLKNMQNRARGAVAQRLPAFLQSRPAGVTIDVRDIRQVMTPLPETVTTDATVAEAARVMAEAAIGDVLVTEEGTQRLVGIVTDRDITIHAVAVGRDPTSTRVDEIISGDLTTVRPTDTVQEAIARMEAANVRRLPVVEDGIAIGMVSLGDLSLATDTGPTLADITMASPDE
jgi:CBS domain-containing protein